MTATDPYKELLRNVPEELHATFRAMADIRCAGFWIADGIRPDEDTPAGVNPARTYLTAVGDDGGRRWARIGDVQHDDTVNLLHQHLPLAADHKDWDPGDSDDADHDPWDDSYWIRINVLRLCSVGDRAEPQRSIEEQPKERRKHYVAVGYNREDRAPSFYRGVYEFETRAQWPPDGTLAKYRCWLNTTAERLLAEFVTGNGITR